MPSVKQKTKWHRIVDFLCKKNMDKNQDKRSTQTENEKQPGNMSSFNKRDTERSTESEGAVKEEKDEGDSFMDYNGNSEANAPARARE
jgi:hypothetical protein